ncbi:MAG: hypothetical protein Q8O22_07260 [Candidatus Omnitrophota bacterium]|nr:hypothetical protein [Candidatus Omnitrophota bacterium]
MDAPKHRVIAMLDRQELDFLDKLGKDALFSTGHKLTHNDILRGLVDFIRDIGISAEMVTSGAQLKEKIIERIVNKTAHVATGN